MSSLDELATIEIALTIIRNSTASDCLQYPDELATIENVLASIRNFRIALDSPSLADSNVLVVMAWELSAA